MPVVSSARPEEVAAEVRSWLHDRWDPDLPLAEWRRGLVDSGWAAPSWPTQWWGRGLPAWSDELVRSEIMAAGAVGPPVGVGAWLAAPTILEHGPDEMRSRFLRPTLLGEVTWCQLFSEPGAGSDLAGLTCRAELDGEHWVVSGQKVWNTSAHHADFGLLLARTRWTGSKHDGLTYLVIPMRQPGIEVRPLRQMNHHSSFNEVFLTEAQVPRDHVVGEEGGGWRVALTTLAHERRFGSLGRPSLPSSDARAIVEARAEADEFFETYRWYPQRAGRADLVIDRAREEGVATDRVVRQEVARLTAMNRAAGLTAARAAAARALGRPPGPEGSIGKLSLSLVARQAAAVHSTISGAHAMLTGPDSPAGGIVAEVLVSVPAQSIAGGTDEIQRNILGEKALGLPREPSPDR